MLDYILQKQIISCSFNDVNSNWKWRLNLALVNSQWFRHIRNLFCDGLLAEFKFVVDNDIYWLGRFLNSSCFYYYAGSISLDIRRSKLSFIDGMQSLVSKPTLRELTIRANENSAFDMFDALVPFINSNPSIRSLRVVSSFHLSQCVSAYERLVNLVKSIAIPIVEWSVYGMQTVTALSDIHTHLESNPIKIYSMIKYDTFSRYPSFYFNHLVNHITTFNYRCSNMPSDDLLSFLNGCKHLDRLELQLMEPQTQTAYQHMESLMLFLEHSKTITQLEFWSHVPHEYIYKLMANKILKHLLFQLNDPIISRNTNKIPAINRSLTSLSLESSFKPQFANYPIVLNPNDYLVSLTRLSIRFSKPTQHRFREALSFIIDNKTVRYLEVSSALNIDLLILFRLIADNEGIEHLHTKSMIEKSEHNNLIHWKEISNSIKKNSYLRKINISTYSDTPPNYIEFSEFISKNTQFNQLDILPNSLSCILTIN